MTADLNRKVHEALGLPTPNAEYWDQSECSRHLGLHPNDPCNCVKRVEYPDHSGDPRLWAPLQTKLMKAGWSPMFNVADNRYLWLNRPNWYNKLTTNPAHYPQESRDLIEMYTPLIAVISDNSSDDLLKFGICTCEAFLKLEAK